MTDHRNNPGIPFTIGGGGTPPHTPADLRRREEALREAQAHLDEVAARVSAPPPELYDPRYRTLPEDLAGWERERRASQARLDEAQSIERAGQAALADALGSASPEEIDRLQQAHSDAHAEVAAAQRRVDRLGGFIERARDRLPEDEEAEAHARVAAAELSVRLIAFGLDQIRAELLPERCREAVDLLAGHATDEWLDRHGPTDPGRREVVRPQVRANIGAQIATAMFRPSLAGLDKAIDITGDPEPGREDERTAAAGEPANGPERTLNSLRLQPGD